MIVRVRRPHPQRCCWMWYSNSSRKWRMKLATGMAAASPSAHMVRPSILQPCRPAGPDPPYGLRHVRCDALRAPASRCPRGTACTGHTTLHNRSAQCAPARAPCRWCRPSRSPSPRQHRTGLGDGVVIHVQLIITSPRSTGVEEPPESRPELASAAYAAGHLEQSANGVPSGIRNCRLFTCPETENSLEPPLFGLPILRNQSPPWRRISGTEPGFRCY